MKCDYCMNSRPIVSENGTHYACCLSSKVAMKCIAGDKDSFIERPCISKIFIKEQKKG